jgi:pimeloyl-ACP methyl ester carboxylesterase
MNTNIENSMSHSSGYATCAGREIHYTEWGAQHSHTVVAWHGLARTGRDMDELARHMSARYRVICPDTLGRGLSQWSPCLYTHLTLPTILLV